MSDRDRQQAWEQHLEQGQPTLSAAPTPALHSADDVLDRVVESAIVRGLFGHNDMKRREFIRLSGTGMLAAILGSIIPLDNVKAAVKESLGPLEKRQLKIGFVPITCATP
ncbi:MAG: ABC transporter substrate-binding protein, partial [Gammaproteobacteria bacterium]|nr:ABC transporter substrate-binding protein [Gammaproteobacteria bacterium]